MDLFIPRAGSESQQGSPQGREADRPASLPSQSGQLRTPYLQPDPSFRPTDTHDVSSEPPDPSQDCGFLLLPSSS